ncbi:MAG TPA: hypothetical protein VF837_01340 [Patescibacteria group bacterium]
MERLRGSALAAIFQSQEGNVFFVEYQTNLELEKLVNEHGKNGSILIGATPIGEVQEMIGHQRIHFPEENLQFRR